MNESQKTTSDINAQSEGEVVRTRGATSMTKRMLTTKSRIAERKIGTVSENV